MTVMLADVASHCFIVVSTESVLLENDGWRFQTEI